MAEASWDRQLCSGYGKKAVVHGVCVCVCVCVYLCICVCLCPVHGICLCVEGEYFMYSLI